MKRLVEEYLRSLKLSEAEEWPDTLFFRPVAFVFVKAVYRTPITPNVVSLLSLAAGLISAWQFAEGDGTALWWGGVWMAVANMLDCADGQLARLQQSGTPLGRLIDGVVDYIIGVAVFAGIGIGLGRAGETAWGLVVVAGISIALHASLFDRHQRSYIRHARGEADDAGTEREKFTAQLRNARGGGAHLVRALLIRLYLVYLRAQSSSSTVRSVIDPREYLTVNRGIIRFWTLLGPSTTRTILILCAMAGNMTQFLWIVVGALNILMLVLLFAQRRADARISPDRI